MKLNAKSIFSAVGVAALLASPVMAKTVRHHRPALQTSVPADARAYAGTNVGNERPVQTVYAPDVPVPPHNIGLNPDFQLGSENN